MSVLTKKLFFITEDDIKCVRKFYGKSEEDIKKDCDVLQKWMQQQIHLPDDYDFTRVERILMRNKFRVERTKEKLENYYSDRRANQAFLRNMDPGGEGMQTFFKTVSIAPMPKLLNNLERIYVQRFTKHDKIFCLEHNCLIALALFELELTQEYAIGLRYIIDYENFTLTHLKTFEVNLISKIFFMFKELLSARILSLEYINAPPALNLLLDILKIAMPEKLFKKIRIHKNLESLRSVISEECLPSDYGGKLRSMDEIYGDVQQCLMENREYLMNRIEVVSDESKRVGDVRKNEMFGLDGTFKRINLD